MRFFKNLLQTVLFLSMCSVTFAQKKRAKNKTEKPVLIDATKTPLESSQTGVLLSNTSKKFQNLFYEALSMRLIEKPKKALELLSRCENMYPTSPMGFVALEIAKNYKTQKDYTKAQTYLQKALEVAPNQIALLIELQEVLSYQKKFEQAIAILEQLVSKNTLFNYDLASAYLEANHFKKALQVLNTYQDLHPYDTHRILKLQEEIYQKSADKKLIYKDLDLKLSQNSKQAMLYLKAIEIAEMMQDTLKSAQYAKLFRAALPNSEYATILDFNAALAAKNTSEAEGLLKELQSSYSISEKQLQKATTDFYRWSQKTTDQKYTSQNKQVQPQWQEVVKHLDLDAKDWLLKFENYQINNPTSSSKEAKLVALTTQLKATPYDFGILKEVLLLQMALKKYSEAQTKITDALEAFPTQPLFYLIAAELSLLEKAPEKALVHLDAGSEYVIDTPKLAYVFYQKLADTFGRLKQPQKAKHFKNKVKSLFEQPLDKFLIIL